MDKINKLKILALSFWTPPLIRPRAILIGKIMPELIKQGIDPVIVSYNNGAKWDIDAPVYNIPVLNPAKGVLDNFLCRNFNEHLYYRRIFKQVGNIIREHGIKTVFSFSNPQASNILGAMLRKKMGIKFISHFSDPWYDNPYKFFNGMGAKKVLFLEKFIIKNSDKVVFTNDMALNLVMKKYPDSWRKKARVIPHCYNPKDYPEAVKKSDKFIFSYIGAFYKQRNPEIFFQALKKILDKNPEFKKRFLVKLVGVINDYAGYSEKTVKEMIKKYGLTEIVELLPVVNYQDSLRLMKESDCLIAIDANFENSPFLPSKLIDYAGSNAIIIGITPDKSPSAEFLKNLGYRSFNYSQTDDLADYISKLIRREIDIKINNQYLEKFDVKNVVQELIKFF